MRRKYRYCGRNWRIREGNNKYWRIAQKYNLQDTLPEGFAIQGEICGPKIQQNCLGLRADDFFVFDVFSLMSQNHWTHAAVDDMCAALKLQRVPTLCVLTPDDPQRPVSIEGWLQLANGVYRGTRAASCARSVVWTQQC